MADQIKNSRRRYRAFIADNGLWAFARRKSVIEKQRSDKEPPPAKPVKYYLSRYIDEFKRQKTTLLSVLALGFCSCLLGMALPWTSKVMIDYILPKKEVRLLVLACVLLLAITLLRQGLSLFQDYLSQALRGRFVINLKQRLMEHLQALPLVELQKLKTGGIITRLQEDSEGAGSLLFNGFLSPINALTMLIFSMASLFLISWKMTLVCLVFALSMCGLAYFLFYIMRPFQRTLCQDKSVVNANLTESFGGIQVVKSFCREKTIQIDYAVSTNVLWRKSLYSHITGMFVHRGIGLIHCVAEIGIWLVGGYYFITGSLSLGSVVVFITMLGWVFQPIFMIMSSFSETQRCLACAERTLDLLDMAPDMVDKAQASSIERFTTAIRFQDVTFKYPGGAQAIDHIDLTIPYGKVTALVGPSGGGKTTITNLALRFYDVTTGAITIDGVDIRDIRLRSYRALISLVLQDVFLFDGTVRDNIAFGRKNATQEEIEQAARMAHCDEFVRTLKNQYDTLIGERGVKLSGGQKQRLALARALVAKPQLLILDEATSNLDSESESLIQDALRHIFKERTTLVIAHRLSTIMDADNIVVLDKGRVLEQGTHTALLEKRGRYYDLYNKQMEKTRTTQNIWNTVEPDRKDESPGST